MICQNLAEISTIPALPLLLNGCGVVTDVGDRCGVVTDGGDGCGVVTDGVIVLV